MIALDRSRIRVLTEGSWGMGIAKHWNDDLLGSADERGNAWAQTTPDRQIFTEAAVQLIPFLVVLVAVIAIFITTPPGRRLAASIGFRPGMKDPAPKKDRGYLLQVCGGDPVAVEAMLAQARGNRSEMTEREVYRAAIRVHLRGKM